jgi:hypothetical protein
VRSRASYLLSRLVKEVAANEGLMRPLVEHLVAAGQVSETPLLPASFAGLACVLLFLLWISNARRCCHCRRCAGDAKACA